jgi:hypothetical protein
MLRSYLAVGALVATTLSAGCVNVFVRTDVRAITPPAGTDVTTVLVPVKAHMRDGSTVVFRRGAALSRHRIDGVGEAFALMSARPTASTGVPLDSVVAVEAFDGSIRALETVVVSAAATVAGIIGTAGLAVAIFGSCPTIYADSGAGLALQAEGFSYSIAPALERNDLDALRVRPDARGIVRLELRNEAMETHYLNRVALVAVAHAPGTRVVPDQSGRPVAVSGLRPIERATDRQGRDVRATLAAADGDLFGTSPAIVAAARAGDFDDWIELDASSLPPGDSVAVVLRLRNSLLNTVLLYQGMLGGRDAMQWLEGDLRTAPGIVALAAWYGKTMGMRATVVGGPPQPARLGDVGPIAFRDVAIVLPRPARDAERLRVRLQFVADNWRIDHAEVAGIVQRPTVDTVPLSAVIVPNPSDGRGPTPDPAAKRALASGDSTYLQTTPGQRLTLEFTPPVPPTTMATTYLVSWRGWYREWIRGEWLANPTRTTPFKPGDAAILEALTRWQAQRDEFERAFYATRLPVR